MRSSQYVEEKDPRALLCERLDHRGADAVAATGDDNRFARQAGIDCVRHLLFHLLRA